MFLDINIISIIYVLLVKILLYRYLFANIYVVGQKRKKKVK